MTSSRRARVPSRREHIRRETRSLQRRCWECVRSVGRKLAAAPLSIRIIAIVATVAGRLFRGEFPLSCRAQALRDVFPVSAALNKTPIETWRQYAPLFREYSTATITPELLAALAQVESTGNPLANTYWRWRLTWDPFAIYQPASSSVGMYQMTDAAFAETRLYCIRGHTVIESGCWWNGLYTGRAEPRDRAYSRVFRPKCRRRFRAPARQVRHRSA